MKNNMKKRGVSLTLTAAFIVSAMTGCSGGAANAPITSETEVTTVAETETEAPERDLGGMEIIIGDWWSTGVEEEPATAMAEATQEYRQMIQEKYNFTIKQISIGDYASHQETFTVSTMAEDPKAQIYIMDPSMIAQPMANGLFYDLASLDSIDVQDEKWNQAVTDLMMRDGHVYGIKEGAPEPRLGVFWNKRMFRDAGLDSDLLYDLQKNGEWTWDKFEEICEKLTADHDNDGITDIYAMASFSKDLFTGAVLSNNAQWVEKDESGKYVSKTNDPQFLEAMQWARGMMDKGYEMPTPTDAAWDWFMSAFHDGKVAMTVADQHKVSFWKDMKDEYGFVMLPKGPKMEDHVTNINENVVVIPACYDKETAEKIAFAYNLYTNPVPGYEDADDWKSLYYTEFYDERAVDETLTMMREPHRQKVQYISIIYGIESGDIVYQVYGGWSTPAQMIEQVAGLWQAALDDANKGIE